MRRLAVNPSVGVRRQLPLHKGGPVAGRPYFLWSGVRTAILSLPGWTQPAFVLLPGAGAQYGCSVTLHNRVRERNMTAQALGPGDGLSHPEHRGRAVHKAFSEFWVQRHAGPVSGRPDSLCLSSYNLPGAGAQYDCPGTGPEITRRQCRKSLKRISGSLHRSEGSGPPGVEMGRKFVYNIIRKDSMSVGWEV